VAGSSLFFSICLALVIAWAAGLALGASDRFEETAAGQMSAMTLILVALMKNAELRAEHAIQKKLDTIASSLLVDNRGNAGDADEQLETAIGSHEEI
jgi:low affinity Fe/Cu permease